MNVTQQQVRRRGSSLDESAIRATLSQGLLVRPPQIQNNDEFNDSEKSLFSTGVASVGISNKDYFQANFNTETVDSSGQASFSLCGSLLRVTLVAVLSLLGGFFLTAMARQYNFTMPVENSSNVKATESSLDLSSMRERCLSNSTYCPQLSFSQFSADYSAFARGQNKAGKCYKESREYDPKCEANCELLFRKMVNETEAQKKVMLACQLGCAYAKQEKSEAPDSSKEANCQFDCRNTVWVSLPGKPRKCNYDLGLGLVTTYFESSHGSGVFGAGKACEVGCILGNSRPCPNC